MARLGLSSPWVIYYRKLEALFSEDDEVKVIFNEDEKEVTLYVDDDSKASALSELLPGEVEFGSYVLKVTVVPSNCLKKQNGTDAKLVANAFSGNSALSYIKTVQVGTNHMTFVVFVKEVVQYFTDDLGDIHGIHSTLYQDLAKDIFCNLDGVYFCTDVESGFGLVSLPLGEWP